MTETYVDSGPYKWPFNGNLTPHNTCIIVIVSGREIVGNNDDDNCIIQI
jgi:hypothetical protein